MTSKTTPEHPTRLTLDSLDDTSRIKLLTSTASYPCSTVLSCCNPGFVGPEDLVPLFFSLVNVLLCPYKTSDPIWL